MIEADHDNLDRVRATITTLTREPAIRSLPVGRLELEHARWEAERNRPAAIPTETTGPSMSTRARHQPTYIYGTPARDEGIPR